MIEITLSEFLQKPSKHISSVLDKNDKILLVVGDRRLLLLSLFDYTMVRTSMEIAASVFSNDHLEETSANH